MADFRFVVVDSATRPDLIDQAQALADRAWDEFMMHDRVVNVHWDRLYTEHPEFQFFLLEVDSERVMALGNSVPVPWGRSVDELPDRGIDWALTTAFDNPPAGVARIQCALQIVVNPDQLGAGLSTEAVRAMKSIGKRFGCTDLCAPVRPNHKCRYPLTPMERYVRWRTAEGLPFDPWMRVHARMGAEIVRVCPKSMHIDGTVADWERWTGMLFPETGDYIVPGALAPVQVDTEGDRGVYVEPNVWMRHRL